MADEEETLRALERRLGEASETAQRLMAEAAAAAAQHQVADREPERADAAPTSGQDWVKPPPAGWQASGQDRPGAPGAEFEPLIAAVRSLRDLVPPEVRQRLAEAIKDVLLALRGLIDWYIERLERRRAEPPPVEDIPIE